MLTNYFKNAFRIMWKDRGFSLINIAGLTTGIAACLLIALYVLDEVSFDRFHANQDRLFRLTPTLHFPDGDRPRAVTSPPMGPALVDNFPEVEKMTRLSRSSRFLSAGEKKFYDTRLLYADSAFFEMFTFPMIEGDAKTALTQPWSVVLTESTAKKYFGNESALGKAMALSDSLTLNVTGVVADVPANSHLQFDVVMSRATINEMTNHEPEDNWFSNNYYTYVLLRDGANPKTLEAKFPEFLEKRLADEKKESGLWYDFYLQPVTDIHLKSNLAAEMAPNGNIRYVYLFSVIGGLVLLIACANYINLSTARSAKRAKELGVRKIVGAKRFQLITQLFGESFIMTTLSSILAINFVLMALPAFNELTAKQLSFDYILRSDVLVIFGALFIAINLVAGSYPAWVLSSFSPVNTLKTKSFFGREKFLLRKGLVVFQFTISIVLIAGTIIVSKQMSFLQNQNLGLKKDQLIQLNLSSSAALKYELIKSEVMKLPAVQTATVSNFSFRDGISTIALLPEGTPDNEMTAECTLVGDHDFLNTFGIQLIAGRNFSPDSKVDAEQAFIVNEAAVKRFGWETPQQALGKKLDWGLGKKGQVVGVVKDFNFSSLHETIRPLIIHILPDWYGYVTMKVNGADMQQTVADLEKTWKTLNIDSPFEYSFVDEDFARLYRAEQQIQTIVMLMSSLAIVIACLGLLGLIAFTAQQRTKEIGVRKVLGANVFSVVKLLSVDFLKLIAASIVIAVPVAWLISTKWLEGFAYKTEASWWIFALSALVAVIIAIGTICIQAIKAAVTNPVNSLRSE